MNVFVFVLSVSMAGSAFLAWLHIPSPWGDNAPPLTVTAAEVLQPLFDTPPGQSAPALTNAPPELLLFLASFVLAAVLALVALMIRPPRLLVAATGLMPIALLVWLGAGLVIEMQRSGLRPGELFEHLRTLGITARDLQSLLGETGRFLGAGLYLWFGSALALIVTAVAMGNARRHDAATDRTAGDTDAGADTGAGQPGPGPDGREAVRSGTDPAGIPDHRQP